jgi:prepilin-type N-terminal cleavage/methylation domain-containing protein
MNLRCKKTSGFTLVEAILVIAILGIIAGIGISSIVTASDALSFLTVRSEVDQSADVAMARMLSDMRRLKDNLSVNTANASQFRFLDVDSTDINYYLNGNNLMRNSNILASNVASLAITYYDINGAQLNPPVAGIGTATDIYRIKIILTFQGGVYTFSYQSQVGPRNLR